MKSIHLMTAAEMQAAREARTPYYGTVMTKRVSIQDDDAPRSRGFGLGVAREFRRVTLVSDHEDYDPEALLVTIEESREAGWQEVLPNRYTDRGMHPRQRQKSTA